MTPGETFAVIKGYNERKNCDYKAEWERTRFIGTILANQWAGKGKQKSARELFPFPWDEDEEGATPANIEELRKEMGWQQPH